MSRKNSEVKMERDGSEIAIMPASVSHYQKNGWTRVEDRSSEEVAKLTEYQRLSADNWSRSADPSKDKE